jgi:hypothetical protein
MTATWSAVLVLGALVGAASGQARKDSVGPRPPDELKKEPDAKAVVGPVEPSSEPPLTTAQIITLLKAGASSDQIIRDIRAGNGRYRITDDQMQLLKAAGASAALLGLLTAERADPLTVDEAIAIAKMPITDAEREKMIRYRPLGFPLDDFAVMRRLAAADAGNMLLILKRRATALGKRPDPGGPGVQAVDPLNPSVVVRDFTYEVGPNHTVLFTFTLENQLSYGVRALRLKAEYVTRFQGGNPIAPVEESEDLGELEPFERRRWRQVRLHKSDAPLQFVNVRLHVRWERDDSPPKRYTRYTMRDVDRAVGIYDPAGFLDVVPAPEWTHRFTLINRGRFAVNDVAVLLRIYDANDRPIWYHEHTLAGTVNPGEVRRESINSVSLAGLWDRERKKWAGPEPAKADLVLLRALPAEPADPTAPRALDTVAGLEVAQPECSWLGAENPAGVLHFFNFTVVNRQATPVKDVVLLVRFRDAAGVPVNYESVVVLPGIVRGNEARRFRRIVENKHLGLIIEGDRAAAMEIAVLSATPVRNPQP